MNKPENGEPEIVILTNLPDVDPDTARKAAGGLRYVPLPPGAITRAAAEASTSSADAPEGTMADEGTADVEAYQAFVADLGEKLDTETGLGEVLKRMPDAAEEQQSPPGGAQHEGEQPWQQQ